MRKAITATTIFIFGIFITTAFAQNGIEIIESKYSVEETAERLEEVLKDNELTIFKKVNHQEGAASVNMDLPPTTVFIFGNPKLGTPLMQCAPTAAIDLPQKMLIWKNQDGRVLVGYNSLDYLKKRHDIKGCDQEIQKITGALKKFVQTVAGIN